VIEFLTGYDGGNCFFVTPERLTDDPTPRDVDGLGSPGRSDFNRLHDELERQLGFDAVIGEHDVTPEQCPALNFLFRTRNQPGAAPRLDIVTTALARNPPTLTGTIAEFGDRHLELLLITDDGYVLNATGRLRAASQTITFSLPLGKTGPPGPQLVFAIASSKPLEALKLSTDVRAEQVFSQVLREASQRGLTLNVSAKFFTLQ
jgi:hypothetical protein